MRILYIVVVIFCCNSTLLSQTGVQYFGEKIDLDSLPLELKSKAELYLNPIDFNQRLKKLPGLSIFDNYINDEITYYTDSIVTERGININRYYYDNNKLKKKETITGRGAAFQSSYLYDDNGNLTQEENNVDKTSYSYEGGKLKSYKTIKSNSEVFLEYLDKENCEVRNTWMARKDSSRDSIYYTDNGKILKATSHQYSFYNNIDRFENEFTDSGNVSAQVFEQMTSLQGTVKNHYVGKETRAYNKNNWITSQVRGLTNKANYTKLILFDRTFKYDAYLTKAGNYVLIKSMIEKQHNKSSIDIYTLDHKYNWVVHEREEQGEYLKTIFRKIEYTDQ